MPLSVISFSTLDKCIIWMKSGKPGSDIPNELELRQVIQSVETKIEVEIADE
jgi:hypothetical protein